MRLLIGNTDIELAPGESIVLTRSNAQIARLGTRSGSFTNDFSIVMSANNLRELGYANRLEAISNVDPSKKIDATLVRDTGGEIERGFIQIVEPDIAANVIRITFYSGNSGWIQGLKGRSIRDIYLRDYDHEYSEANIVASWSNTDGYIYPVIDYGKYTFSDVRETFVDDWFPAVFQSTLIRRMFESIGWKAAGSFLNSWDYKHTIIPFTNGVFLEDNASELTAEARKESTTDYEIVELTASGTNRTDTDILDFDTIIKDEIGALDVSTDRYTADRTLNDATFRISIQGQATIGLGAATNTNASITIQIRKNGTMVVEDEIAALTNITGSGNTTVNGPFTLSYQSDLVATDYIDAVAVLAYDTAVAGVTVITIRLSVDIFIFELSDINSEILPGGNVTLANNLPDLDQAAFVKDMIVRHGLLAIPDTKTQTVYFEPLSAFRNNTQLAQDWSDYVTNLNLSKIDFVEVVNGFAKRNFYKYKTPNDDDTYVSEYNDTYSPNFGDGELDIDNDFIPATTDIYTSIFEPTKQIRSFPTLTGDTLIPYIPMVSYDGSRSLQSGARILYVVQDTENAAFMETLLTSIFIDGTGYNESAFAFFAKPALNSILDNIQSSLAYDIPEIQPKTGIGLIDKYYSDYIDILNSPKYVKLGVKIFSNVFDNLDLGLPVFIDDVNIKGYFLVDQVIFRDDQESEIRLIKI